MYYPFNLFKRGDEEHGDTLIIKTSPNAKDGKVYLLEVDIDELKKSFPELADKSDKEILKFINLFKQSIYRLLSWSVK